MHPDPIHRRRMVLHGVLQAIAEQLPLEGVTDEKVAFAAWKRYFCVLFWPNCSSEDVIRRPDWNETVLRVEAWAAARGVTFTTKGTA